MKTFQQFQIDVHQLDEGKDALRKIAFKGLSKLTNSMRAGPAIKYLRTAFNKPVRMYHGTLKTAANKIMNKGFTPTQTVNPKTLSTELSNVYLTTNPKRAQYYADLMAKTKKGKADIVAVNVDKTKNIRKGVRGDEFVVPVKDTIPVAQDVKPIKRRKGEVIQDNYQYIKEAKFDKLFKKYGPNVIKAIRNKRAFKMPTDFFGGEDGANAVRGAEHLIRKISPKIKKNLFPFEKVREPNTMSRLAIKKKSVYPPDVSDATDEIAKLKVEVQDRKDNKLMQNIEQIKRRFNKSQTKK